MSVKYTSTKVKVVKFYKCDCCKTVIEKDDALFEFQEMLHFNTVGGYGSIFGDGSKISLDLCQHCGQKLLGEFLTIGPSTVQQIESIK